MQNPVHRVILPPSQWLRLLFVTAGALFLGAVALFLLRQLLYILAVLFLAATIAAALSPVIRFLAQYLPRTIATILTYVVLVLIFLTGFAVLIPALGPQIELLIDRLPDLFQRFEGWVEQQGWVSMDRVFDTAFNQVQNLGSEIIGFPLGLFSTVLEATLVLVISVYMTLEVEGVRRFGLSLLPESQQDRAADVVTEMLSSAGGYVRGVAFNIVIVGALTYVGLRLIGVEFALVLSIFAGMLEIIPFAGPLIASVPIVIVALLQSPTTGLITAGFLLLVQQLEGNVITPNVMHKQAHISQLLVLIALFAGSTIAGVLGALVAIPFAAALRVLFVRVIAPAIREAQAKAEPPAARAEGSG